MVLCSDIDGVLNRVDQNTHIRVDDDLVRRLVRIMESNPDSHIVLSTFWRHFTSYITYVLWRHGIDSRRIAGMTGGYDSSLAQVDYPCGHIPPTLEWTGQPHYENRADEIREWLKEHPNVKRFVILDDRVDAADGELLTHFVHTTSSRGLGEEELAAVNSILETDREDLAMVGALSDLFDAGACIREPERRQLQLVGTTEAAAAAAAASTDAWLVEWRVRFHCWFAALPGPTQGELGSCLGALGLHLSQRLDAAWQQASGQPLARATPSAASTPEGCEWVREDGRLQLPQFPSFPADRADFTLPPIPRLLPSLQHLQQLQSRIERVGRDHSEWTALQAAFGAGAAVTLPLGIFLKLWRGRKQTGIVRRYWESEPPASEQQIQC